MRFDSRKMKLIATSILVLSVPIVGAQQNRMALSPVLDAPQPRVDVVAKLQSTELAQTQMMETAVSKPASMVTETQQTGSIHGTVVDVNQGIVPGASISLDGPTPVDHYTTTSDGYGYFEFVGVKASVPYHITVVVNGFTTWTSKAIVLQSGQILGLSDLVLRPKAVVTTVAAATRDELALQQVKVEEDQRVLGVIPNFYVVYDRNAVPLTTKLKFSLALRSSFDAATIAGVAFLATIDQAAHNPDYQEGWKGYGQRFGANTASGFTDILVGGAVLPSLLHQDPRFFYQKSGSTKSRLLHALETPIICKGDNGHLQPNYSSIGGDLVAGAVSNLYFPQSNRGISLVLDNALIGLGGRIANGMIQQFLLVRLSSAKSREKINDEAP
jgi:Carboxypeptidase regulatory-like domain